MRVLFLGTSHVEPRGGVRGEQVAANVTAERARASGASFEVINRKIWPTKDSPACVAEWMAEVEPDMVILAINDFWYNHESAPRHLERRYGPVGRFVSKWAKKAARTPRISYNPVFQRSRRFAEERLGGETPFTPEHVIETVEMILRTVVRGERATPLVIGPPPGDFEEVSERSRAWRLKRRRKVNDAVASLCKTLHIVHFDMDSEAMQTLPTVTTIGDGLHRDAEGHQRVAAHMVPYLLPHFQAELQREAERTAIKVQ